MNSYPLISHRLYIAAIGNEGSPAKPEQNETGFVQPGTVHAIPLELLDNAKATPAPDVRPLRAAARRARS